MPKVMKQVPALVQEQGNVSDVARRIFLRELRAAMADIRTGERMVKQGRQRLLELTRLLG